jgi:DNA repair protein RecO (recombination protein O)
MSEIIKTDAVVISKMDYSNTSKIAVLFTNEFGKISVLVKGARSAQAKTGRTVDVLNYIQVILNKKETRELQYVNQVDLLDGYSKIKDDLVKLKYAVTGLELINALIPEAEQHSRLFRGLVKILSQINNTTSHPAIPMLRFILFFLKEIGFELQLDNCFYCGKEFSDAESVSFNFEKGTICSSCSKDHLISFTFTKELFNFFLCLRQKESNIKVNDRDIEIAYYFIEKYLKYHVPEFKGIKSIHLY